MKDYMMGRFSIIGAGKLGKTLGKLLAAAGLQIGDILNQSQNSTQAAVTFIGSGRACTTMSELKAADYYLLACPDHQIQACCQQLAASGVLQAGMTVFHCSGALNTTVLHSATAQGAHTASIHPVRSFAQPPLAAAEFPGTYCALEGDAAALAQLEPLFVSLGAIPFHIDPAQKTLYHAASVMACNYLVTLQDLSLQALEQAGVERDLGMNILHPLVKGTINNLFTSGTAAALTGPIARGEHSVVAAQLEALQAWSPDIAKVYRALGQQSLKLAAQQPQQKAANLARVARALAAAS